MKKIVLAALLGGMTSQPLWAAEGDAYLGVNVGSSSSKVTGVATTKATVGGFVLGRMLRDDLAIEAEFTGASKLADTWIASKTDVLSFSGLWLFSVWPDVSLYGKLGLGYARTVTSTLPVGAVTGRNAITPVWGAGVQYNLTPNFRLRGGYDNYTGSVQPNAVIGNDFSIGKVSLGVQMLF
jgi:opacity protein-like surface antigen